MRVVGFTIEIYYDSRPFEGQIPNNFVFPRVSCRLFQAIPHIAERILKSNCPFVFLCQYSQ
jgi:hypothetical protein